MARPTVPAVGDFNWGEVLRSALFDISDRTDGANVALSAKADLAGGRLPVTQLPVLASTNISDFTEAAQDATGAFIKAGANVTLTLDDAGNSLTISSTAAGGGTVTMDNEVVRDVIGAALVAGSGIQITVNDVADTITITAAAVPLASVTGLQTALNGKISTTGLTGSNLSYAAAMALTTRPVLPTDVSVRVYGGTKDDPRPPWFIAGDYRDLFAS